MSYEHILLVTDLLSDADIVAQKAKRIVENRPNAKLSVLHIVKDTMVGFGYELVPASSLYDQIDDERCQEARAKLAQFLDRNELHDVNSEVTTAISNSEGIVNYCHKHEVDLLVIGRHNRHGIAAWLSGATADNILPNVPCDSLVVRLDKPVNE
ncbi:universal stress protein [Psychrobacter alimentarius]|mgnify:FL=1|uniref:Universal stress protein n=1 Tax=Psychrobacter alimentarius TaxID=261164 RepID=A0ABM6A0W8_9GAMM|nr:MULTISPECIES: universal stress protein [Psychrobacter]AMT97948.1 Universal stress protein [Psychrobacter alimentarius]PAT62779.1 universal stress protein [Psychrobacter sp. JB193]QCB29776.1 universal stress protein [Psychrobacter sp. PAMC27889]